MFYAAVYAAQALGFYAREGVGGRMFDTIIRGGDVVLLHDGSHLAMGGDRAQTVIATDHLLTRWKAEYNFVTIDEMRAGEAVTPKASTAPL